MLHAPVSIFSGRNFFQLTQQALDTAAHGFALFLKSLDLLLCLRQLRRLLIKKLLQSRGILFGDSAGLALFLEQFDGAEDALFERVEIVGSNVDFNIFQCKRGHRYLYEREKIQLFFAQYSLFCAEEIQESAQTLKKATTLIRMLVFPTLFVACLD